MLAKYVRPLLSIPVAKLVEWMQGAGVTPNMVTYAGFLLTIVSAIILGTGAFRIGGFVLWAAAMLDMLDGSLARATNQSSVFGAFIDSTLDRYSESVTFLAMVYYYSAVPGSRIQLVLIFIILVGSLMVSYTRARAEGLNVKVTEGWLQRPERLTLLITGLILGYYILNPILWAMAIFTNLTALQRVYEVYWRLRNEVTVKK